MWEFLLDVTFDIINFFYSFVGDWGMAIIIVTVIFRACLAPLMSKQIKSSYHMQKLQPLMQEIQTKYKDDPVRMNEEMQKLYAEGHFNPLAGCLPMLLQMPIFMLLFQVLRTMGDRIQGSSYEFYHLVPNLTESPSAAIGVRFRALPSLPDPHDHLRGCHVPAHGLAAAQHRRPAEDPDDHHGGRHVGHVPLDCMGLPGGRSALLGHLDAHRHRPAAAHDAPPEEA